ncbi:MAG: AI-2E family transporter [Gammaproteobacteria bacterium]|nr:AI-2E family transporter [Gammaproteobacteria bacterium]MDH5651098.1 AI-2E family transporter [Gammaproteobacteria bacterium]
MFQTLANWYKRYFSDPHAVLLALILIVGFTVVLTMGNMLAPALAAIVLAYLLEDIVQYVKHRLKIPRYYSVLIVYILFLAFTVFLIFGIVPSIVFQVKELVRELPNYIAKGKETLLQLPQHYSLVSVKQVEKFVESFDKELATMGQQVLTFSLSSIPNMITLLVYSILVPLLIFFFLKDKWILLSWLSRFLPPERRMASQVWEEMDQQLGNYVRGKFWEIVIVTVACVISFGLMGLKYAILLSVLVGLSVLVPYIGAAVVTIPVAFIAYFQWGWTSEFAYLMVAYTIIQALDGNVLVPLLFSEVVNLHPVAIIVSILVFGGLWGFWGIFFAIPLATLVSATLRAFSHLPEHESPVTPTP